MRKQTALVSASCLALWLLASSANAADSASHDPIAVAVAAEHRAAGNRQRDGYRHPQEVLHFFGLAPDMTVVEIWPSRGWWTEILAPVMRENGRYIAAGFAMTADRTPGWRKEIQKEFAEMLEATPEIYDNVVVTELSVPERTSFAHAGTVDLVLTFRNVHNWMNGDYAPQMFAAMARALRPGGVLGVVEHRAPEDMSVADMKRSGYVSETHVIELARDAGLVLEARSEINANPRDTKDHPVGVWTLPPSLRLCGRMDSDGERRDCERRYRAIGESDRMTLRFRKAQE